MEAPGFPVGPTSNLPLAVVALLLAVVLAAAVVTAVRVAHRHGTGTVWRLLPVLAVLGALVPVLVLWLPASAHVGTDTAGGRGECPMPTLSAAFMGGEPGTRLFEFWRPCQDASRLRVGLSVGGYALVAGAVGVLSLTRTGKARAAGGPTREPTRVG